MALGSINAAQSKLFVLSTIYVHTQIQLVPANRQICRRMRGDPCRGQNEHSETGKSNRLTELLRGWPRSQICIRMRGDPCRAQTEYSERETAPDWTGVDQIGRGCTRVDQTGPEWTRLDQTAPDWASQDQIGPDWTRLGKIRPH